jgi:hypothetical protein
VILALSQLPCNGHKEIRPRRVHSAQANEKQEISNYTSLDEHVAQMTYGAIRNFGDAHAFM